MSVSGCYFATKVHSKHSPFQIHSLFFILVSYIFGICASNVTIPKNENGFYQIGDMILDDEQLEKHYGIPRKSVPRSGVIYRDKKWEDGILPYEIHSTSNFLREEVQLIRKSVAKFNNVMDGCVRIR